MELLITEKISKRFPGVEALRDIDFACNAGEVHALVGENGAGKSTLAKILGGLITPSEGRIIFNGQQRIFRSPLEAWKDGIRVVPQETVLVPELSVAENLFLGREKFINRLSKFWMSYKKWFRLAHEVFQNFDLDLDPSLPVYSLPIAEQKWVQIAQAIIASPKLLVLDEPTASFSEPDVEKLFCIMRKLKEQDVGIVYISHRLDEVLAVADRVTVLKDGKKVGTYDRQQATPHDLVKLMIGRDLGDMFPPRRSKDAKVPALEVKGLTIKRAGIINTSFTLYEGEILGIGGLKGSGQDILLRALFGLMPWESGEIKLYDKKCKIKNPKQAIRNGIVLITEYREQEGLAPALSVRYNMALPNLSLWSRFGLINYRRETQSLLKTAKSLNLQAQSLEQPVWQLSGGNKQKTILGKWFLRSPRIWLLIEPTMGIDVGTKREIYFTLRALTDEAKHSIILVTTDTKELVGLCDRVIIMRQGKIVAEFSEGEITEENIVRAALGVTHA
jgi:ribose transport system ATP-binding protein